jgi:hypothetical protein
MRVLDRVVCFILGAGLATAPLIADVRTIGGSLDHCEPWDQRPSDNAQRSSTGS